MAAILATVSTLAGSAAADVSPRALARTTRAPESRCASEMCQSVTDEDEPAASAQPAADDPPP
ncbi:MAG TPA: hypothetical protein VMG12_01535, partial [Polyangiaceae bacterium]|nr:hypothetical protein [Polyangiaceae bacterium]